MSVAWRSAWKNNGPAPPNVITHDAVSSNATPACCTKNNKKPPSARPVRNAPPNPRK
ncbi:hypothetical protein D3C81_2023210 [compost metagenome]